MLRDKAKGWKGVLEVKVLIFSTKSTVVSLIYYISTIHMVKTISHMMFLNCYINFGLVLKFLNTIVISPLTLKDIL